MRNMTRITFVILSVLLLASLSSTSNFVLGKVHVRVMNRLGHGRSMQIHCQSQDDDLGCLTVPDGREIEWKFYVNFWGTTLFYCAVQWNGSVWHHFDAYSYKRDDNRCEARCNWMISEDGRLFGFNQKHGTWDVVQFQDAQWRTCDSLLAEVEEDNQLMDKNGGRASFLTFFIPLLHFSPLLDNAILITLDFICKLINYW